MLSRWPCRHKLLTNSVFHNLLERRKNKTRKSKEEKKKKRNRKIFQLGIKYYRFNSGRFHFPSLQSPHYGGLELNDNITRAISLPGHRIPDASGANNITLFACWLVRNNCFCPDGLTAMIGSLKDFPSVLTLFTEERFSLWGDCFWMESFFAFSPIIFFFLEIYF